MAGHHNNRKLHLAILQCAENGLEYGLKILHVMEREGYRVQLTGWWWPQLGDLQDVLLVHNEQGYRLTSFSGQPLYELGVPEDYPKAWWSPGGKLCFLNAWQHVRHPCILHRQMGKWIATPCARAAWGSKRVWPAAGSCILVWDYDVLKDFSADPISERRPFVVLHYGHV